MLFKVCEIGSGPTSTTTGGNPVSSEALLQEEHNLKGMDPVQKVGAPLHRSPTYGSRFSSSAMAPSPPTSSPFWHR